MGTLGLVILLFLAAKAAGAKVPAPAPGVPSSSPGAPAAQAAQEHKQEAQALQAQAVLQNAAAKMPPPFPQAAPSGLPAFPGPGWKPWNPVPAAVTMRAVQLLPVLWSKGAGARQFEKTTGEWTAYLATPMAGGKKGVTAHRLIAPGANA